MEKKVSGSERGMGDAADGIVATGSYPCVTCTGRMKAPPLNSTYGSRVRPNLKEFGGRKEEGEGSARAGGRSVTRACPFQPEPRRCFSREDRARLVPTLTLASARFLSSWNEWPVMTSAKQLWCPTERASCEWAGAAEAEAAARRAATEAAAKKRIVDGLDERLARKSAFGRDGEGDSLLVIPAVMTGFDGSSATLFIRMPVLSCGAPKYLRPKKEPNRHNPCPLFTSIPSICTINSIFLSIRPSY